MSIQLHVFVVLLIFYYLRNALDVPILYVFYMRSIMYSLWLCMRIIEIRAKNSDYPAKCVDKVQIYGLADQQLQRRVG